MHTFDEDDRGMNPTAVWAGLMGMSHEIGLNRFLGHVTADWSSCWQTEPLGITLSCPVKALLMYVGD